MSSRLRTLTLLIEGDNILLALKKRGFGEGRWNGVGGKVDYGETIAEAMIRETEEEIFVTPEEYEAAGILELHYPEPVGDITVHIFVCTAWDGEPLESEEMAPRWFKIREIPYERMWPDDIFWLPMVLEGKFVRGDFVFDANDAILSHTVHEV